MLSPPTLYLFALAMAAAAPRAAVIPIEATSDVKPAQRSAIEAALNMRGYRSIDEVDAQLLIGSASAQARAPQALYIEAKKALMNFNDDSARTKLEQARAELCESPRILAERVLLSDTHLLGGLIALASGQTAKAEQDFALAALLEPERQLHPGLYPPDVLAAFDSAKQQIAERPRGAVAVETRPAAAHLYVNGVSRGQAPLVIDNLAAGPHYVTAVIEDRGARTRVVTIEGGHSTQLLLYVPDPGAEPPSQLLAAYQEAPGDAARAVTLLEAVGADLLIAVGDRQIAGALVAEDGQIASVVIEADEAEPDLSARVVQVLDKVEGLAKSLATPSNPPPTDPQPDGIKPGPDGAPSATPGEPDEPLSPWVWVAVGGGGVALATTAVVVTVVVVNQLTPPPPPEERVRIVW